MKYFTNRQTNTGTLKVLYMIDCLSLQRAIIITDPLHFSKYSKLSNVITQLPPTFQRNLNMYALGKRSWAEKIMNKNPLLIMHFQRANTIYSYWVPWWLNAVCCPPFPPCLLNGKGNEEWHVRREAGTGGETAQQTIISAPVYLPVGSISQAADESLMSRLHRGSALLNALYL